MKVENYHPPPSIIEKQKSVPEQEIDEKNKNYTFKAQFLFKGLRENVVI